MPWTYPHSDFDQPQALLAPLGSFWSRTYQGKDLAASILAAVGQLAEQTHDDLQELTDSLSRAKCPVFHRKNWTKLTLLQSQCNRKYAVPTFGGGGVFDFQNGLSFGMPAAQPYFAWPLPAGLVAVPVLLNRITLSSQTLICGVDYLVQDGYLIFRNDPFADPLIAASPILVDNVVTDQQCNLWVFRGHYDQQALYQLYGYALELQLPSSERYKQLLNAVFAALVSGTTTKELDQAWSAIADVPLVRHSQETVEVLLTGDNCQQVVTSQEVYTFSLDANITVVPGQVVQQGDTLCDALTVYEFNRGQTPPAAQVPALAVSKNILTPGFLGDIVFQNQAVPLQVSSDEDGYTTVSWATAGWPGDVEQFFAQLQARGRAMGKTLAELLDQRPLANRDSQPQAGALPATINPVQFLCQNVLRDNAFLVCVRPAAFGPNALGLGAARYLRKIVPPQTLMMVAVTLEFTGAALTIEGPDSTICFHADVQTYTGQDVPAVLTDANLAGDVRLRQIGGYCV